MSRPIVEIIRESFVPLANAGDAKAMAAYMKTSMPFYGIKKPARVPIHRALIKQFSVDNQREYEANVRALWKLPHREEKYAAIAYAMAFKKLITPDSIPLYEQLIREGQWWDFVDDVAIKLVGGALLKDRRAVGPIMDVWIDDEDMWIRRAAILSQNKHRLDTDEKRLFRYCEARAHEKEFFIRKAIGWALREYASVRPDAVRAFLRRNEGKLSTLSVREAAKHL